MHRFQQLCIRVTRLLLQKPLTLFLRSLSLVVHGHHEWTSVVLEGRVGEREGASGYMFSSCLSLMV